MREPLKIDVNDLDKLSGVNWPHHSEMHEQWLEKYMDILKKYGLSYKDVKSISLDGTVNLEEWA